MSSPIVHERVTERSQGPSTVPAVLACNELSYSVGGTVILDDVTLAVEKGEILAVVGSQGCGKTSLLNCLAFRQSRHARVGGQIFLNGVLGSRALFQEKCAYVLADSRLLPYLTVEEVLTTAAGLKLPGASQKRIAKRVDTVIAELGLERCRHTYIGGEWRKGISTGEKKRVNIAIELLDEPSVLVLDGPTAGLDSSLASELIVLFRKIAASGRTVIFSLSQPTSQVWSQLDSVLLLGGKTVLYCGKARDMRDYFGSLGFWCPDHYNPLDYALGVLGSALGEITGFNGVLHHSTPATSDAVAVVADTSSSHHPGSNAPGASELPDTEHTRELGTLLLRTNPTQGGVSGADDTLTVFVEVYKQSKSRELLRRRVKDGLFHALHDKEKKNATKPLWARVPKVAIRRRAKEIRLLTKRSFINAIRNPVVCCVVLLVQALQGLILGGIFGNLTKEVQQFTAWDFPKIFETPLMRLAINGTGGEDHRHPLIEALEEGVNGNGSQPLTELLGDSLSLLRAHAYMQCGAAKQQSALKGYPSFGWATRFSGGAETVDDIIRQLALPLKATDVAYDVVRLLQLLDHFRYGVDYTPLATTSGSLWWQTLTQIVAPDGIDPYLTCGNYKPFSTGSIDAPQRRQLITVDTDEVLNATLGLLSERGDPRPFISFNILMETFKRLISCEHAACKTLVDYATQAHKLATELYSTLMATATILGALFFAVANLGFASYDSLLTFPQERALFNRESSTGLYKASSYFIAKNLADLPFQLIPSVVLITVFYFLTHLGGTFGQYLIYCVVCAGVTFAAYGFGYLVSAATPRLEIATVVAPVTLVIWLTVAGFFIRDEVIPSWIHWASYISFYKWGFFSLVLNQFPENRYFGVLPNRVPRALSGVPETPLVVTLLYLYGLGFLYRFVAFLVLKYAHRNAGVTC